MTETLQTARLLLRPLALADAPQIATLVGDMDMARWLTLVPHPYHEADAVGFVEGSQKQGRYWALTEGEALFGVISIGAELGYWLGKPYWGQGLMTEAAWAVVADHFSTSEETLASGYHLGNAASASVLAKLGFEDTETRQAFSRARKCDVTIQGMRLTADRWKAAA